MQDIYKPIGQAPVPYSEGPVPFSLPLSHVPLILGIPYAQDGSFSALILFSSLLADAV